MKLKKVKTASEIEAALRAPRGNRPLIELNTVDGTIKGVRIGTAHFSVDSYSFSAHAEQAFDTEKLYKLVATTKGFPTVCTYYDSAYTAETAASEYGEGVETKVSGPIDVMIDDGGNIVGEVELERAAQAINDEDIPF